MRLRGRSLCLFIALTLLLILPPAYLLMGDRYGSAADPAEILIDYLKAAYARDFRQAYRLISSEDRRLKDEKTYLRERGAFDGFTLEVGRKLADWIQATPIEEKTSGSQAHIKLKLKLPDASKLSESLLDWDEERLNALSSKEQRALLQKLDQWSTQGEIPVIEGEQEFDLVRDGGGWRLFLNWAAGIRVNFQARVNDSLPLEVRWDQREVIGRPDDLFNVHLRIKNLSNREVFTKSLHRVEPKGLAQYLDLVDCALLLPAKLLPHEEQEYASTYLIRGDLPDGTKQIAVTYEFTNVR
jgi:Cytochrome c oxidase assembly protein CtaG/Cox11